MSIPEQTGLKPEDPTEYLSRAMADADPRNRKRHASAGLAHPELLPSDTHALLLRQLYLAHLDMNELDQALDVAEQMVAVRSLSEIAYHDLSRVCAALDDWDRAILAQRQACREALPSRRGFQLFALATLQHAAGDDLGALETLHRAERWSARGSALLRAYQAYLRLELDESVPGLQGIIDELKASRSANGYGQYVLGRIAHKLGDSREASIHLRAFLRRHAAASGAQRISLREELRSARRILATIAN